MANDNNKLTPATSGEWLTSCGFLFPSTEEELLRFNSILGEVDPQITGSSVDPFRIIRNAEPGGVKKMKTGKVLPFNPHRMVAKRSNEDTLPKKNSKIQKGKGSSEEATEKE